MTSQIISSSQTTSSILNNEAITDSFSSLSASDTIQTKNVMVELKNVFKNKPKLRQNPELLCSIIGENMLDDGNFSNLGDMVRAAAAEDGRRFAKQRSAGKYIEYYCSRSGLPELKAVKKIIIQKKLVAVLNLRSFLMA